MAAAKGHLKCLEMLVEHGGYLLARNKRGETPLQLSENMNQEEIIHYIATKPQSLTAKVRITCVYS